MKQYLTFDIGGTNLKYALIDEQGSILVKDRIRTNTENLTDFMSTMYQIADKYQTKFAGIAVCAPGKIDTKNKIIHFGGALPFLDGLNLQEKLGNKYKVPIAVENDGKAAALSEQWLGELQGINTAAVMTLGTGVGGGIIVDGHVLHGCNFQAGELSWMIIDKSKGVNQMSAFTGDCCSAVNMVKQINKVIGNVDLQDGLSAFKAINEHQEKACHIFSDFCKNIAIMILNVQAVINGEAVVIGGGISAQPILITEIKKQFNNLLLANKMLGS